MGKNWTSWTNYTPVGTSLKIHGALNAFDCYRTSYNNKNSILAINASGNKGLQELYCNNNELRSLELTGLTRLQKLDCRYNHLISLDLSGLISLQELYCNNNELRSLELTGLTRLQKLDCRYNYLTNLDLRGLISLQELYCNNNELYSLNTSDLISLQTLDCYDNPCVSTTFGLDQIYCQLPPRSLADTAKIHITLQASADPFILASNGANAINKHWKIYGGQANLYFHESIYEINNTTGTYECGTIPVTEIILSPTILKLIPGETKNISAIVLSADATDKSLIWSSDNPEVATVTVAHVSDICIVEAKSAGSANITAKSKDGTCVATCVVTVEDDNIAIVVTVTGVTLDKETLTIKKGESASLVATVSPADATNKSVNWSSDKPNIATVNNAGEITAIAVGTATITVTTEDGSFTANCVVTVEDDNTAIAVTGVTLDKETLTIKKGESASLVATVSPADATNKSVNWSSDKPNIATVDNAGEITAVAVGIATITVTTDDGSFTANCLVTVEDKGSVEELIASGVNVWTLNGVLHINFKETTLSDRNVAVFDMSGKLVYSNATPTDELQIYLSSGVYIVKVGNISFKVLIIQ